MDELENVPKQTGTAVLDFEGKLVKVRSPRYRCDKRGIQCIVPDEPS